MERERHPPTLALHGRHGLHGLHGKGCIDLRKKAR
jgi:hypothetical protein